MARKVEAYTAGLEREVAERTRELREANAVLAESQRRVLDSINYARLIQDSIFPRRADLDAALGGHFLLSRPRDLVGGDFVFFRPMDDGFCLAVVDCTGHGVPGAIMTMMVKAHLDRVTSARAADKPSGMLAELDRLVQESLSKEGELAHFENGLDIAFCRYRAPARRLEFAGGGLPLFLWREGVLEEIGGDHLGLGFTGGRRARSWRDHELEAGAGLRAWLVSDGVLDLPGAESGQGLGRTRLRSILAAAAPLCMAEQEASIAAALALWQGDRPQRDDLSLVGFIIDPALEA
jgi:serine phosphatase RsbU (regulator of sigma subunit)